MRVTPRQVLAALETLAERLGVVVRAEAFSKGILQGHGGLCRVDGKPVVLMDERLALPDRVGVLATALSGFPWAEERLPPAVRDALTRASRRRGKRTRSLARVPRPGLARAKPRQG